MPVDLNTLYTYGESQLGTDKERPIHLVDGQPVLVLEPLGTLPGCWTRFRAALVNVPLLGRLEALQAAARQVQAARPALEALRSAAALRKDVHQRLQALFGPRIAKQAIRAAERRGAQTEPGPAPSHSKVLTASKLTGAISHARAKARSCAEQNDVRVKRFSGLSDGHECSLAAIFVKAELQGRYFRESLSRGEIARAIEPLRTLLEELRKAGIDPAGIVGPYIESYARHALDTLPENGPNQAVSYRDSFRSIADAALNRRKVQSLRPTPPAHPAESSGGAGSQDRDAVGTAEVDIVLALCASFDPNPDDPRPRISNTVVRKAWKDLEEVRSELSKQLPAPSDERLTEALIRVARGRTADTNPAGRPKLSRDQLFQRMRTALIAGELAREFDAPHWQSTFDRALGAVYPLRATFCFSFLREQLEEDMLESIERRAPTLHEELGCAQDVQAVVAAARERLIEHTVQATRDSLEADDILGYSTSLLEEQKELFLAYTRPAGKAPPQRLDPVLVEQCEHVANAMAGALPRIQAAIEADSPAALFDEVKEIAHAWTCAMTEIRKNAETMWMLLRHDHLGREEALLRLCAKLALARLRHDGQPIDGTLLAGPGPGTGSDGNASRSSAADHPVNQFLEACEQSPWRSVSSKIGALYGDPLLPICGGVTPPGTLTHRSEHTPLHKIRPELLVRTLIQPFRELRDRTADVDPQDVDPSNIDLRGVLLTAPNAQRIRKDFALPAAWKSGVTRRWVWRRRYGRIGRERPPPAAGSPQALEELRGDVNKLAASSRILVAGRRPPEPPLRSRFEQALETFKSLFADPHDGPALASAVSAYMQEAVLSQFRKDVNDAAFGDAPLFAVSSPDVHELRRESDGSWRIRSSCTAHPQSLDGEPLNTEGVILYTLEHRVTPDGSGGAPWIELIDAKVVFAF